MRRTTFASILVPVAAFLLITGCTDPTEAPEERQRGQVLHLNIP